VSTPNCSKALRHTAKSSCFRIWTCLFGLNPKRTRCALMDHCNWLINAMAHPPPAVLVLQRKSVILAPSQSPTSFPNMRDSQPQQSNMYSEGSVLLTSSL
jgi:hypothetical protein